MTVRLRLPTAAAALLLTTGCFAARTVRPVGEGNISAGLSVGGPIFTNLGAPIPTPLATAYVRYGVTNETDVDVGLSLPIVGAAGIDAGAAHQVLRQEGWRPAVSLGGRLLLYANLLGLSGAQDRDGRPYDAGVRLFEEAYGYASWQLHEAWLAYAGLDLFAQAEQAIVRPTLLGGLQWQASRAVGLQLEVKQMALATNQEYAAVAFVGPGNYGAFAVNLGLSFTFERQPPTPPLAQPSAPVTAGPVDALPPLYPEKPVDSTSAEASTPTAGAL